MSDIKHIGDENADPPAWAVGGLGVVALLGTLLIIKIIKDSRKGK